MLVEENVIKIFFSLIDVFKKIMKYTMNLDNFFGGGKLLDSEKKVLAEKEYRS